MAAIPEPLEEVLMDFLSLGERFNWDQLVAFVAQIPDTGTLHQLAGQARNAGDTIARALCRGRIVRQTRGRGRIPRQIQSDRLEGPRRRPGLWRGRRGRTGAARPAFLPSGLGTARHRI